MMLRSFLFFGLLFMMSLAQAKQAVLLTSLKLSPGKIKRIEKEFHKNFEKSGLTTIVLHQAGPKKLQEAMSNKENVVVIWVSHAAADREVKPGMVAANVILDAFGNDVKKFFTNPHENMRFLGIVGCQAKSIIDGFWERGLYYHRPELEIMSFDKKIELFSGLKQSFERSLEVLERPQDDVRSEVVEQVKISVTQPENGSSGWLELGDRVLGYVDGQSSGVQTFKYDKDLWDGLNNRNIKFFKDLGVQTEDSDLKPISINPSKILGTWKLFATPAGKPLGGKNQQLYIYKR